MQVVAIIPARAGSKGIPGKNLRILAGKPLVRWSIDVALAVGLDTVVTTDCPKVAEIAKSAGVQVIDRPARFATDTSPVIQAVQHAVNRLKSTHDAILILQPTNPCRTEQDVREAMLRLPGATSVISFVRCDEWHPYRMAQIDGDEIRWCHADRWQPRQFLPTFGLRDGSIYLVKADLVKQGFLDGTKPRAMWVDSARSVRIDTESDWRRAEEILTTEPEFAKIPQAKRETDKRPTRRQTKRKRS